MPKFRQLELLKAQETTLEQLHMTFSDQFNRLKVEELALTNLLRLQQEKELGQNKAPGPESTQENAESNVLEPAGAAYLTALDLSVQNKPAANEEEEEEDEDSEEGGQDDEEEEEEEDNYQCQLNTFLEDLLVQQQDQQQQQQQQQQDGETVKQELTDEEEDMEDGDGV